MKPVSGTESNWELPVDSHWAHGRHFTQLLSFSAGVWSASCSSVESRQINDPCAVSRELRRRYTVRRPSGRTPVITSAASSTSTGTQWAYHVHLQPRHDLQGGTRWVGQQTLVRRRQQYYTIGRRRRRRHCRRRRTAAPLAPTSQLDGDVWQQLVDVCADRQGVAGRLTGSREHIECT